MNEQLNRLQDLSAYIRAARAVARAAAEQLPTNSQALDLEQANHLGALSEAVRYLLAHADAMANALETAMGAEASRCPALAANVTLPPAAATHMPSGNAKCRRSWLMKEEK